ncbi:RidA family protein [Arenibaculum pallidiluteum]|uniref:RidA family protein n=1 Tax=Arenibaculum pallidiluteum TaxID=2812559 RepID=UPI001A96A3A1|nr:RidA family protein [Arenibaculum pallidiluteum]
MAGTIAERVRAAGYVLPEPTAPAANYVSSTRAGNLLFISGQVCQRDGSPGPLGRVGEALSVEDGRQAAALCALSVLAHVSAAVGGEAARVRKILRLGVFVSATAEFDRHSQVADGASDLMVAVLGEAGRHARTAVGVVSLPRGVAVEVDAIVELAGEGSAP